MTRTSGNPSGFWPAETPAETMRRLGLVRELEAEGIRDRRVLDAIAAVPRHLFVPEPLRELAYLNRALAIGEGQTISQPFVVATMTQALALRGAEKVLEIGTGSGYQAAILARLAAAVHTVERCAELHRLAVERLERFGLTNVRCYLGDGTRGLPEEAPFDAICVTAASPAVPAPLREQLAPGGRLVIPVGDRRSQGLVRLTRLPGGDRVEDFCPVLFVPLVGAYGWPDAGE